MVGFVAITIGGCKVLGIAIFRGLAILFPTLLGGNDKTILALMHSFISSPLVGLFHETAFILATRVVNNSRMNQQDE